MTRAESLRFDTLATACAPVPPRVGDEVVCTVTGGDPGIEILWRVAVNPVVAEGPVALDAERSGTFGFTVPAAAVGVTLAMVLVAAALMDRRRARVAR
jgi:hypothetical protein